MSTPEFAWSHSAISIFWQCPYRFYRTKIKKDVKDVPKGPAIERGNYVHKALERRLDMGVELPKNLRFLERMCARLQALAGTVKCELELALDEDYNLVEWFSPTTWLRVKVDFLLISPDGTQAMALDWKTGKRKDDDKQLALYAATLFKLYPDLVKVICNNVWIGRDAAEMGDPLTFSRKSEELLWNKYLPTVSKVHECIELDDWKKRPSGLCKGFCPVTSCKFWQPKTET